MFSAASLTTTLLLAISIAATPVEVRSPRTSTLSFTKQINTNGSPINVVQHDQARATALKGGDVNAKLQARAIPSVPYNATVFNAGVLYMVSAAVGIPPTTYNLVVDTSSANTWVGADKPYHPTAGASKTNDTVSVNYGYANFSGDEWIDSIVLADDLSIRFCSLGVATTAKGFASGVDGIMGLGPVGLSKGTLTNKQWTAIPTITDMLYLDGPPIYEIVSIFLAPPTSVHDMNGELSFGGVDPSKYNGNVFYYPITSTSPSSNYWGLDLSLTYGSEQLLSRTAGIIDSSSALILIPSDAYTKYQQETGATKDGATKMLKLTESQYGNLKNLDFNIGGTFTLMPNGQIWPRVLNSYVGGTNGGIYSVIGDIGAYSRQGLDIVLGQAFLERFYTVFDTVHQQVGIATTNYTDATTN